MPSETKQIDDGGPKRAFELTISIGADDRKSMLRLLEHYSAQLAEGSNSVVSGGYDAGGWFAVTERPEQTHEKWSADLDAHLAARKAAPNA